jgi:hypothetical protein
LREVPEKVFSPHKTMVFDVTTYSQTKTIAENPVEILPRCANCFGFENIAAFQAGKHGRYGKKWSWANSMLKVKDTLRATVHLSFDGPGVQNLSRAERARRVCQ